MKIGTKLTIATLCIGILLLLLYAIHLPDQSTEKEQLKQELLQITHQRDSAIMEGRLIKEALTQAIIELEEAEEETKKANKQTNVFRKKYEEIYFVKFSSDSVRNSELTNLYPSLRNH